MKATVDKETCIGCGTCPEVCPEVFHMTDGGIAHAIDGEIPNDSMLYFLNKNILKYRKESERVWLLIRRLISGQIHMEQ